MWNTAMPADGGKGEPITLTLKDGVVHLVLVSTEPQLIIDRPDLKLRYTLSKADVATLLKLDEPAPVEPSKPAAAANRSEEHTSELQSLMRHSYAVFCLKQKTN